MPVRPSAVAEASNNRNRNNKNNSTNNNNNPTEAQPKESVEPTATTRVVNVAEGCDPVSNVAGFSDDPPAVAAVIPIIEDILDAVSTAFCRDWLIHELLRW